MLLSYLQRLASACGPSGLGLASSSITAAAVACSCSSSTWRQIRPFSYEASDSDKPAEEPAAGAAPDAGDDAIAAAAGEAEGSGNAIVATEEEGEEEMEENIPAGLIDVDGSKLPPEMFSKRQLAWMGVGDPDKTKHFLPALSRKELGSFADEYAAEQFDIEQELFPTVPEDIPLYDLREVVPEIYQPRSELFERLQRLKVDKHPDMPIEQFVREVVGAKAPPDEPPPRPGARRIIRWQIRHVLSVGVREGHPANRRVKAWLYLRDLQREHGLTDAALQHIAAICGPRYNPRRGELQLTSDRYPHREANRAHVMQIIRDLVQEGHRKHPPPVQQQAQAPQPQPQPQAVA